MCASGTPRRKTTVNSFRFVSHHHQHHLCRDILDRLGVLQVGSCEGGALPVIMPITGPRKTHDHRELNL